VGIQWSYSGLLWNILQKEYHKLGFDPLNDEIFEALVIARIVEPTSKLDSLRVLDDLGVDPINRNKLYRSIVKAANQDFAGVLVKPVVDMYKIMISPWCCMMSLLSTSRYRRRMNIESLDKAKSVVWNLRSL